MAKKSKTKAPARTAKVRKGVREAAKDLAVDNSKMSKEIDNLSASDMAKEVDRVVNEKTQVDLLKGTTTFEDDGAGKEALRSEDQDRYRQADFIPGSRRRDLLMLPESVYDEASGEKRKAFGPDGSQRFHYCWVEGSDITRFKVTGYKMVPYNGGRGGLPSPGLSGTGMYECDISNHIKLGDAYLMFCDMRLYEALCQEDQEASDNLQRLGANNFHNMGYRHGSKTFEEIDGVRQAN